VIEEIDEQMTITAGGQIVCTVFPSQPPLPNDSASSNLSNITYYTEVLSTNDNFGYHLANVSLHINSIH